MRAIQLIFSTLILYVVLSTTALSMPLYNFGGSVIIGVSNLPVDDELWELTLHDLTFNELRENVGSSAIHTESFSRNASTSLASFIDSERTSGDMFLGCQSTLFNCTIITPYVITGVDVAGHSAEVGSLGATRFRDQVELLFDSVQISQTIGTWRLAPPVHVPEPSVGFLVVLGLIVFGFVRRKVRAI